MPDARSLWRIRPDVRLYFDGNSVPDANGIGTSSPRGSADRVAASDHPLQAGSPSSSAESSDKRPNVPARRNRNLADTQRSMLTRSRCVWRNAIVSRTVDRVFSGSPLPLPHHRDIAEASSRCTVMQRACGDGRSRPSHRLHRRRPTIDAGRSRWSANREPCRMVAHCRLSNAWPAGRDAIMPARSIISTNRWNRYWLSDRPRARLGMVLHRERRPVGAGDPLVGAVEQRHMRHLRVRRQRVRIHRETMVLAGDLHLPGRQILHRLVGAAMAALQLVCLRTQRQGQQLMAEADAEHRHAAIKDLPQDAAPHNRRSPPDRQDRWTGTRRPACAAGCPRLSPSPAPP